MSTWAKELTSNVCLHNNENKNEKVIKALFFFSGDGGNDVSMIQAADCGIGIEGKVKTGVYCTSSSVIF